ncbi:hypothetical protein BD289DRAFT_86009 [Coniella lustricola]|uniref:Inner kinetochore subunit AME1 domain-containing protein n=1 Tax=Coniella lustricola TaxID=2025994 RepID=A0A2T2ZYU7_9PEZI|nr:hypothetical protein BD289DRAFT_86009 [Coniella lustricola]
MEQTREDRMRNRMRGAARHNVENADFGELFAIPAAAPQADLERETEPEPSDPSAALTQSPARGQQIAGGAKRTSPNTSAKRRRLNVGDIAAIPELSLPEPSSSRLRPAREPSKRIVSSDPYSISNAPTSAEQSEAGPDSSPPPPSPSQRNRATRKAAAPPLAAVQQIGAPPLLPPPPPPPPPHESSPLSAHRSEEVTESPAHAPGSGQRRRLRTGGAWDSSALLQSAMRSADNDTGTGFLPSSSPLSRKSRKSLAVISGLPRVNQTGLRRSTRLSDSPDDSPNELSSDPPATRKKMKGAGVGNFDPEKTIPEVAKSVRGDARSQLAAGNQEEDDLQAQEINDQSAAIHLSRKRQRRNAPASPPELSPDEAVEEPVAKRPRAVAARRPSPAHQRQPKSTRAAVKKPSTAARKQKTQKDGDDERPAVPVTVQRFTRLKKPDGSSDSEDVLSLDIPYANRSGVNAVDVLAQICEEIIGRSVAKQMDALNNAQDAATKKEHRIKYRALEAFQEQLRMQLLEQTIALDDLFILQKRVRDASREKLKLRARIMEIRAEREQVALRMDALRIKHDSESKVALHNIHLSAAMHDIDLAIEQGYAAAEPTPKEQQNAELANLELIISQIAEQVYSSGPGGGALNQIVSFNAFLERTAAVL